VSETFSAQVVKIIYLEPIAVSREESENYRFRIEVAKGYSTNTPYRVCVYQMEFFRLRQIKPTADGPEAHAPRDEEVVVRSVSLLWERIKAATAEGVLRQVLDEIDYVFGGVLGKPAMSLKQSEVVKIVDLEPMSFPERDECFRFRVEVLKESEGLRPYFAQVYNLTHFSIQPTFPIENGQPQLELSSAATHVLDRSFNWKEVKGETPDEVLQKVQTTIRALAGI
jgi:hypothetical protein